MKRKKNFVSFEIIQKTFLVFVLCFLGLFAGLTSCKGSIASNPGRQHSDGSERNVEVLSRNQAPLNVEARRQNPRYGEEIAEYGVLLYGCGGGNLDNVLDFNLAEAAVAGTNARVKMAAQYKYSRAYQYNNNTRGCFRKVLEGNTWTTKEVLSSNCELYKARTLTNFINWAAEEIPARHYILVVWDHGNVWDPYDDSPYPQAVRRGSHHNEIKPQAVIFDDILNNRALSTASLAKGIRDSNKPVKTVYFDVCLMLMMETLQEIRNNAPSVEYCMGAEHLTPGIGGNYRLLLQLLGQAGGSYEQDLQIYVRGTASSPNWWNGNGIGTPHDLTVVRMNDYDDATNALRTYIDAFDALDYRTKAWRLQDAYAYRYQDLDNLNNNEKSTDVVDFLRKLSVNDAELEAMYNDFRTKLRNSFVANEKSQYCALPETSVGIYVMQGFNRSYDQRIYVNTAFDRNVRWSRLLELL